MFYTVFPQKSEIVFHQNEVHLSPVAYKSFYLLSLKYPKIISIRSIHKTDMVRFLHHTLGQNYPVLLNDCPPDIILVLSN